MKTLSLSEAKMKLSSLVDSVYRTDDEVIITKNGSPAAVLISPDEFEGEQKGKARSDYGTYLLDELSKRLTAEFGKGFDRTNISKMRAFYLTYPIADALRPQLTWTHYRLLLRVEKESVRDFYVEECITNNWSTRQLERQINSFYYERLLSSKDKKPVMKEAAQTAFSIKRIQKNQGTEGYNWTS